VHTRYPILANTFLVASLAAECDRQRSQKALEMYWGLLLWTGSGRVHVSIAALYLSSTEAPNCSTLTAQS